MVQAKFKSLAILGRQPALGIAELESLYGAGNLRRVGNSAVELTSESVDIDFDRLGGTLKLARILAELPHEWPNIEQALIEQIPRQLANAPDGKFNLGLSVYGLPVSIQAINRTLMKIKAATREASKRNVRVIPNKAPALNSAQVLHNHLTGLTGWELLLVQDGGRTILAQTVKVQDIEAYAARDQARPRRDARVGMLPPKLAQIIINLANPPTGSTILDPFCGTGVVLQEALLAGYDVVGTDIDERMVEYSQANIDWLRAFRPDLNNQALIERGDACVYTWPPSIGAVVSETYLGRPLAQAPAEAELAKFIGDVNTIVSKFLKNLSPQLKLGAKVSLALPAWRQGRRFATLPLIDRLTDMGYNRIEFQHAASDELIYWREGQIVGRQLLVLEKL